MSEADTTLVLFHKRLKMDVIMEANEYMLEAVKACAHGAQTKKIDSPISDCLSVNEDIGINALPLPPYAL